MVKRAGQTDRLRIILEDGYELIAQRNLITTPRVPRVWEKGFKPEDNNFSRALHQQSVSGDFEKWESTLLEEFKRVGLSWSRFRRKTEEVRERTGNYSAAAGVKRKIDELDRVINMPRVYDAYSLPVGYPPIEFTEGKLVRGAEEHPFKDEQAVILINLLWPGRRIVTSDGVELKTAEPLERDEIYLAIHSSKARFETVVRNISTVSHRKDIGIKVKYPKGTTTAYLEVTQDIL